MVSPLRRVPPAGRRVGRVLHLRPSAGADGDAMTLRLGALHDALLNAGAQPELAQRAAEELANYDRQLNDVRSDLLVVKWMLGVLIVLVSGLFWQGFVIMGRLPR
jgi:hypothetical protein